MVLVACKPINLIVLVGLLVMAIHFLQAGRKRATLPGAEESMTTTIEFITALFCQVDDQLAGFPKSSEAPPLAQRGALLGAFACPQRRRQPGILSLADACLPALLPPPARADPAVSPLQHPSGLDPGLSGLANRARRHRYLRGRID